MVIETSGVNRRRLPLRWLKKVTPSSSTCARRVFPSAMTSSPTSPLVSIASTFLKPAPRLITWNPPESVKVGPGQFMKHPRPPASSTRSEPGCRYR